MSAQHFSYFQRKNLKLETRFGHSLKITQLIHHNIKLTTQYQTYFFLVYPSICHYTTQLTPKATKTGIAITVSIIVMFMSLLIVIIF